MVDYVWYTLWRIISKTGNCAIDDICFKGTLNISCEVEIGYGTEPAHQNRGYMTETVNAIVQWAMNRKELRM
ncbi:MAG: GNAT family N-acetyltransferase [Methanomethylovorans sp.]|nr:GNAT family N-acetyltransferase [Methanomethylovorans sp.]